MVLSTILAVLASAFAFLYMRSERRHISALDSLVFLRNANDTFKRTLAMGLYLRFKSAQEGEKYSDEFIREDPWAFEAFIAWLFERKYGGKAEVTQGSGDYGIDVVHKREDGVYFIQVKCYKDDLPFDAIAKVHSNMVKHGAIGGYVLSTAGYTDAARKYAQGLNVELVTGSDVADMYIEALRAQGERQTSPVATV